MLAPGFMTWFWLPKAAKYYAKLSGAEVVRKSLVLRAPLAKWVLLLTSLLELARPIPTKVSMMFNHDIQNNAAAAANKTVAVLVSWIRGHFHVWHFRLNSGHVVSNLPAKEGVCSKEACCNSSNLHHSFWLICKTLPWLNGRYIKLNLLILNAI